MGVRIRYPCPNTDTLCYNMDTLYIYNNNNNQSLGISLDERKSRAYQVVHPM